MSVVQGSGQTFATTDDLIANVARGEMIVLVDDEDRENEGDLVMAASAVTPQSVNFMKVFGRGLICVPMQQERLDQLGLDLLIRSEDVVTTAFASSVDAYLPGRTGLTAGDMAACIARLGAADSKPADFRKPGHIFPLRGRPGGVLERRGHTEASLDIARLANQPQVAVICEVMNDDGTMARLPQLAEFSDRHSLAIGSIAELAAYRRRNEKLVNRVAATSLPTEYGAFKALLYQAIGSSPVLALIHGDLRAQKSPLVRIHSECRTGDVFHSLRCDCGGQLDDALRKITSEGAGVLLYMLGHEGRGIGLADKIRAYALQERGFDTLAANLELGLVADDRDYIGAALVLSDLDIRAVRLITNNPHKIDALQEFGLQVVERIPSVIAPTSHSARYLDAKRDLMGHLLPLLGGNVADYSPESPGT